MTKITSHIDPKSGLLTVNKSAGGLHPFLRASEINRGGVDKIKQPYAQSVWVMSAIRHIANPLSMVPIKFARDRRLGDELIDDPSLNRFWSQPAITEGGVMRRSDFIAATVSWLKLAGEAFWILDDTWLNPRGSKSPLILARPDKMTEVVDRQTGELIGWRFRDGRNRETLLIPEQVKHIKCFNPYDSIRGLSEWQAATVATESDYAAGLFARNLMHSNGDRGQIVTADGNPSDEQIEQITRQLREKSLLAREGKTKAMFLAGPNMKVQDPTVQSIDADFVSQRLENRHEIYIAFNVPPSFADVTASYSIGSASDYFRLIETGCMPVGAKIADAIEDVSQAFLNTQDTIYAEFDFDEHSTMQQVRAERFEQATKGVDRGISWRVMSDYLGLKLPRFDGDDIARVPANLQPVVTEPTEPTEPTEDKTTIAIAMTELKTLFACDAHLHHDAHLHQGASNASTKMDEVDNQDDDIKPDPARVALWESHLKRRAPWIKRFESRFNRHLMDARRRTLANIERQLKSAQTKTTALDLVFDLSEWLKEFLAGISDVHRQALIEAGLEVQLDELGVDNPSPGANSAVQIALQQRENLLLNAGTEIWTDVRQAISEALDNGDTQADLTATIREVFNGISNTRARTIAATETAAAYEAGRHVIFRERGVQTKEWLTSQDGRVRITHRLIDGQRRPLEDKFDLGNGVQLLHPSESGGPPDEVINCRCISIAVASDNNQ